MTLLKRLSKSQSLGLRGHSALLIQMVLQQLFNNPAEELDLKRFVDSPVLLLHLKRVLGIKMHDMLLGKKENTVMVSVIIFSLS